MKFKIGQHVTPVKKDWNVIFGQMDAGDLPEFGKIYTVAGYPLHGNTDFPPQFWNMIQLEEKHPNKVYMDCFFEALISDEELEEQLNEVENA